MAKTVWDISRRAYLWGGGIILMLALGLRIIGAHGDLAQDEIMSLDGVAQIDRIDKFFWAVNYDNNHPLNSAWLYLVGPDASILMMRAFSIALGCCGVIAAGVWGARRSRITGLIAMLLYATSYLMVSYGSEARGYAGMILFIMLAIMALETTLAGKDRRLILGVCAMIGYLFHFDMCLALMVLAIAGFIALWQRSRNLNQAVDGTMRIFIWPLLFLLPALSPLLTHHFIVASIVPFHLRSFLSACDLSLQASLNICGLSLVYSDVFLAAVLALAWFATHRRDFSAALYVAAIIILPIIIWALKIPNTDFPRHMIVCDIAFLLLSAEILTNAFMRQGWGRIVGIIVLITILAGNGLLLEKFFSSQRGHYSEAVADMTKEGATTYGADLRQVTLIVRFYSDREKTAPLSFIPTIDWCAVGAPHFLILSRVPGETMPDRHVTWGPESCPAEYDQQKLYPAWGLTGINFILFRKVGND